MLHSPCRCIKTRNYPRKKWAGPEGKKRESKEIKSVLSDFKSGKEDAGSQPIKACTEEEASPPVSVINNNNNIKKWKERNLCACFVYRPGFWESRKSEWNKSKYWIEKFSCAFGVCRVSKKRRKSYERRKPEENLSREEEESVKSP